MKSRGKYLPIIIFVTVTGLLFVSNGGTSNGETAVPPVPVVVAQVALKGQTDAIPLTTIFTPRVDGLFRISGYVETAPSIADGSVGLGVFWTDDFSAPGPGGAGNTPLGGAAELSGDNNGHGGPNVVLVRAKANTPLSFSTVGNFPCDASCQYNVFITVEKMPAQSS